MIRFPGFEHLFVMADPVASRPYRGRLCPDTDCFGVSRGEARPPRNAQVHWAMGSSTPSDVIWTTNAHPLIVHHRLTDLWAKEQLSGWGTYPVEVFDKDGRVCHDYAGITVTGRCGVVDLSQSRIELREYPGGHSPEFVGHFFDPESWDGSDFCVPVPDQLGRSSLRRVVSSGVSRSLRHGKVRNVLLESLSSQRVSTSVYEIGLTHLLPSDFVQSVATAYNNAGVIPPEQYRV